MNDKNCPELNLAEYTYDLPQERIAQHPLPERDGSKLLVWKNGSLCEDGFRNIARHLPSDSILVFNDTRVIRARLLFQKATGTTVEILCLEPVKPSCEISMALQMTGPVTWKCLTGNARRWKRDTLEKEIGAADQPFTLKACRTGEVIDGTCSVTFSWDSACTFGEVLEQAGNIPLPPYIARNEVPDDLTRYQTIYATERGSVAAPTAGLHFTSSVLAALQEQKITKAFVTLHVGLGTFRPVTSNDILLHRMHDEQFVVEREVISLLATAPEEQVIAVGTTSVRVLESLYWLGISQIDPTGALPSGVGQWDWFDLPAGKDASRREVLEALLSVMDQKGLSRISAGTSLMIVPGYRFRIVSGMITNFHQPRSTLLLLIAAYLGKSWKDMYRYALDHGFRFLSYGDSCMFLNDQ